MATVKKSAAKKPTAKKPAKRLSPPSFSELPAAEKRRIAGIIISSQRRGVYARGGYRPVHGPDQLNRNWTAAETGVDGELESLPIAERNRIIALARNAARNSDKLEGILHQLELNVIGSEGGKALFDFPPEYAEKGETIHREFAKWAAEAEYFDDRNLQRLLKAVLRTKLIGGDCVLVFDHDVTGGNTGKIISFEPDCIGNLAEADFKKYYSGYTQHQGIVKNAEGKTVGVVCSWAQRGQSEYRLFGKDGERLAWVMIKPADVAWRDCPFTIVRDMSRFNQMRGSSRLWSGLGTVVDLTDIQGFEVQASKKNAQTIAQVTQQAEQNEADLADGLDPDAVSPIAGEVADAEAEQISLDMEHIEGAGCIYDVMPPGVKLELLDTKHPNDQLVEFSKWLHGSVAFALGLGRVYASGEAVASYSGAMAEMMLSSVEFADEFHELEVDVLDWAFAQWSFYAQSRGLIPADAELPPEWRRTCVTWMRPTKRAIDPVKEQQAHEIGLRTGTVSYADIYGADWKRRLDKNAEVAAYLKEKGLPNPQLQLKSGGVITEEEGEEE